MKSVQPGVLTPLGIDHIVLRTKDLEAMIAFYCDVIGCTVERRQEAIGLYQLRAGSALIDLVPIDGKLGRMGGAAPGAEGRNLDHFCLRVAADREHLQSVADDARIDEQCFERCIRHRGHAVGIEG